MDTTLEPPAELPASLRLGPVSLTVSDLERAAGWYAVALGLGVRSRNHASVELGDDEATVVRLVENDRAQPAGRSAGLYHYALLYPSREELARAALRLAHTRTPIQGATDHGSHEAIYLPDADGIGIELAADRPRDQWPARDREPSRSGPQPLNFQSLMGSVDGEAPSPHAPAGVRVGHLHLHVGSVETGLAFYRDVIGFDVWSVSPTAAFVSVGGYHHHLGFNVWRGADVGSAPDDVLGLREWTIELESSDDVDAARERVASASFPVQIVPGGFRTADPWNIPLRIVEAGA
jgi:catechol 2,3-dioxygenase